MGLFNLLQHGPLGVLVGHPNAAQFIAAATATLYSWIANRLWTYRGRTQDNATREAILFFVANICGIAISQFCLLFTHYILGLTSALADNIAVYVVGFVLGTAFRFFFYHYVVFIRTYARVGLRPAVGSKVKETAEHYPTPGESIATMVTIDDTALVFEGGGMRNAYTAALVSRLIAEGINFPHISGVSAGSSHLCNFTSRDAIRSHATFVDLVEDPEFGGLKHFRKGHGYFNAEYIYQQICYPDGVLPFNMDTFLANPATTRVATFNASRGEERWFSKEEMSTLDALGPIVRASSTLPILMPPVESTATPTSMARSAPTVAPLRSATARRLPQAPRRPHAPPRLRQGPHARQCRRAPAHRIPPVPVRL